MRTHMIAIGLMAASATDRTYGGVGISDFVRKERAVLANSSAVAERTEMDVIRRGGASAAAVLTDRCAIETKRRGTNSIEEGREGDGKSQHDRWRFGQQAGLKGGFESVILRINWLNKQNGGEGMECKRLVGVLHCLLLVLIRLMTT